MKAKHHKGSRFSRITMFISSILGLALIVFAFTAPSTIEETGTYSVQLGKNIEN